MSTQREYLDVAVGETITLVGPVEVEFLDRVDGSRMGVASAPAGGELKLTGIESAVFARLVTEPDELQQVADHLYREQTLNDELQSADVDPFSGLDVPFTDQ